MNGFEVVAPVPNEPKSSGVWVSDMWLEEQKKKATDVKLLAKLAHEILERYYTSESSLAWEYGDTEKRIFELEQYMSRTSKRIDYLAGEEGSNL